MKAYPAAGSRPIVLFLMTLGMGSVWTGTSARAERPAQDEPPTATAAETVLAPANGRTRKEGEDGEEEAVEIDPLLRLQLLSAILITSPDVIQNPSGVARAPHTQSSVSSDGLTGGGDGGHIDGDRTPGAPEPASLVLGALGTGLALLTGFRRRRRPAAA